MRRLPPSVRLAVLVVGLLQIGAVLPTAGTPMPIAGATAAPAPQQTGTWLTRSRPE